MSPTTRPDTPWWRDETFLHDLTRAHRDRPDQRAIVSRRVAEGRTETITYRELAVWTVAYRRALLAQGIVGGDRVAVQLGNCWEMAALAYACLSIGAVVVPVSPGVDDAELLHRLTVVEASALVVEAGPEIDHRARLVATGPDTPTPVVLVLGDREVPGSVPLGRLLEPAPSPEVVQAELDRAAGTLDPDAPALMLFTSGTTGPSKAVVHSHNSLHAAMAAYVANFDLTADSVVAVTTPIVSYSGLVQGVVASVLVGATIAIQDVDDPHRFLELVESTGSQVMYGPPHTLLALATAQRSDGRDVSTLQRVIVGSSPVVSTLIDEMQWVFGARTSSLWGMSEFGPAVLTPGDGPADLPARSNGIPIDGVETRIDVDPRSVSGPPTGRLHVRGATRALGYFREQDRFDACIDDDGWFDTGDLARDLGEDGIRVLGRAADVIWSQDGLIPTVELEAAVQLVEGISEACVIASTNGTLIVVASRTTPPAPSEPTLDIIRERLTVDGFGAWLPGRLIVRDRLPKTTTGKVRKRALRELYANDALAVHR